MDFKWFSQNNTIETPYRGVTLFQRIGLFSYTCIDFADDFMNLLFKVPNLEHFENQHILSSVTTA